MTSLQKLVYARCTGYAALAAIIGTRCYPDRVPENATYPLVVYHAPISSTDAEYRTHGDGTGRTQSGVQFDCYASTSIGAETLADAVAAAWNGYSLTCNIGFAFVANRIAERQDDLNEYRQIVDVLIEHKR